MVQKLVAAWNGGKKAFFSALFGAILGTLSTAVTVGEYKGKVDTLEASFTKHVDVYTAEIVRDYNATKTHVAVIDERQAAFQRSLDEIKQQNEEILKLMRRK